MPNIGPMELLIILVIALVLFGGSRLAGNLAGIGKGVGRSIREFKEEVKSTDQDKDGNKPAEPEVVEAEIVSNAASVTWRLASRPSRKPSWRPGKPLSTLVRLRRGTDHIELRHQPC